MWTIDFIYHLFALVPSFLRLPKRMAWLDTMLTGIIDIQTSFNVYRLNVNRRATYTGQIMVLERMLNLQYSSDLNGNPLDIWASPNDPTASGNIYIETVNANLPDDYIWWEFEGQNPQVTYFHGEIGASGYAYFTSEYQSSMAFIVWVPTLLGLSPQQLTAMTARIDKYIIAGFNYSIQTY